MKSSRRKQTTPNRVAAGSRETDPSGVPAMDTSDNGKEEAAQLSNGNINNYNSQQQLSSGDSSDCEQPLNLHVSLHACPHCSEIFSNKDELQEHQIDVHRAGGKKPRTDDPLDVFPTVYHRLGHELQESTELPLANGHLESELSPVAAAPDSTLSPPDTPQSLPLQLSAPEKATEEISYSETFQPPTTIAPKISKEGNGESVNIKSERIFHMDAYCELCDREFCNKYFLKTHKANKHGIYEDNSPPASNVPLPFPGLMIHQDPLASFNFSMDSIKPPSSEPHMHWPFKLEPPPPPPPQHAKKPESPTSVKSADSSIPLFPMSLPGIDSPKSSINKTSGNTYSTGNGAIPISSSSALHSSSSTSILTTITNSIKNAAPSSTTPQINDPSMEDYCHICQKHFCNKYYLKKHKQDVHGIAPENPPNTSNKRSRSSLLDLPPNPMMLHQSFASLAGMHGLHAMPGLPSMPSLPPGVMVINPYSLPPVAIIPAGSLMPGQQMPPPPHPIISQPMSITPMPESGLLPPAPSTQPSTTTVSSSDYSPNKPSPNGQEGGVHCSICSKEFCNEFYLQIHKESKHAIRKETEDGQRSKSVALLKESRQDSPTTMCNTTKYEPSTGHRRSPFDAASTGEGSTLYCSLCSKEFTNKYLFRIHRIHDHGLNELMDPMVIENNDFSHKENIMRNMNETLMMMTANVSSLNHVSNFGLPPSNKPQESAVCDICNKQMANLYFLRLHKFHVHGIDPNINEKCEIKPPNSPVLSMPKPRTPPSSGSWSMNSSSQPLNLAHHPGNSPMLPFLPPKMDFKDMPPFADFGREFKSYRDVPSFLTDTINHELFARSQSQSRHLDLNFFGLPSLGKLPSDDNIKMNFDPEAYCEICKKEFCSKYFLRTHKQNIHGIKSDATSVPVTKGSDSDRIYSMSPLKPTVISSSSISSSGKPHEMLDKSSWRWKEPINSSRVICDICNKEVCNKYFLRIHKQKKHGITPSSQSPNVSTSGSPVASDCDTASNASSQPDEKSFRIDTFTSQMMSLPHTERPLEKFRTQSPNFAEEKVGIPLNNNTEQCETCNICKRRFKNLNWLKDHIVKEHSNNEALDMRSKNSLRVYTCQVCGTDFQTELSVQLHLIQEHNARVTLETEEPQVPTEEASLPNGDGNGSKVAELTGRWTLKKKLPTHRRLKKYVCTRCGFDSHWLSSLLDHERNDHGIISGTDPVFSCKSCHSLFPTSSALSAHLVIVHGFTSEDALREVKLTEPAVPNNFKCAHCSAVFPTRSWGMAHVRHVHIRSRRDLAIKNSFEKSLLRCPSCPFKTHFSFRLQRHVKYRHRNNLRFPHLIYPSISTCINTSTTFPKLSSVPSATITPKEDNALGTAVYKSIAASLLSVPETGRADGSTVDRDSLLLQNFKLPLGSGSVETTPFKFTNQTSVTSAMVGL